LRVLRRSENRGRRGKLQIFANPPIRRGKTGALQGRRPGTLEDLRVPPANRLESLRGERKGQRSIRINDQWRICFVWRNGDAWDVGIVD